MPAILFAPLTRTQITQKFGKNPSWYKRFGLAGHNGIDFRTRWPDSPQGRRYVRAMASGKVIQVGDEGNDGYGRFVRIQHLDGAQSVYGHFSKVLVKVGDFVARPSMGVGTIIGLTDNTGWSTGPHLHVGYRPPDFLKHLDNGFKGSVDFLAKLSV